MTNLMVLYEVVKNKLGSDYNNIMYQTMNEDKEDCVGIYLYESTNELQTIDGNIQYDAVKIHIQVNASKSSEGLNKALNYLDQFTRRIENEQSNIDDVIIIEAMHLGPRAVCIGRNQYDILVCKCDVDLKYIFKSDNA